MPRHRPHRLLRRERSDRCRPGIRVGHPLECGTVETVPPSDVEPVDSIQFEDDEDADLYKPMIQQATEWLEGFRWCRKVESLSGGLAIPGVIAVFLAKIIPAEKGVDTDLWVVVGDVPPAYLVLDDAPDSEQALLAYIECMEDWVSAAKAGDSVDELIPVNVEPTPENAELLASRLAFLQEHVLGQ